MTKIRQRDWETLRMPFDLPDYSCMSSGTSQLVWHLLISFSLQTDGGMCGSPTVVFSDSAGEHELRESLYEMNTNNIDHELARKQIDWHFNPPSSSNVLLQKCCWLLIIVEALLNGWPLTHVSVDLEQPETLTPNHFLLGHANPNLPPGIVEEKDVTL